MKSCTPDVPKKTNLALDVTHSNIINLDKYMSRFVVLGYVTSSIRLIFYGAEEVVYFFVVNVNTYIKSRSSWVGFAISCLAS